MYWIPIGSEHHSFSRTIKLELNALIMLPLLRNVQSDLEPVIRPAGSEFLTLLSGLVRLSLGCFKGGLGATRC